MTKVPEKAVTWKISKFENLIFFTLCFYKKTKFQPNFILYIYPNQT